MSSPAAATGKGRNGGAAIRPAPLHWRIKLYELEDEGSWIDKGTGFVHCKVVGELGGPALVIRSEENDGVIFFQSKVQEDDVYEIQGDNIIMWREPDANSGMGVDYALSFQEKAGCNAIWELIANYQRQILLQMRNSTMGGGGAVTAEHVFAKPDAPPGSGGAGVFSGGEGGGYGHESGDGNRGGFGIGPILSILELSRSPTNSSRGNSVASSQGYTSSGVLLVLPVDFSEDGCLQRIRYRLENLYPAQREFAVCQLLHEDGAYLDKLFNLFDVLETREDIENLNIMADIFRSILLLNSPELLEHFVGSDKVFFRLCGVMEYEKALRERARYRDFMFRTSRYQEVVSFDLCMGSPAQVADVRSACIALYRLRFVRDIILHPKIDDPGITALGSMISFSSTEICAQMLQNTAYMARVLNVIWPALNIDNFLPDDADGEAQPAGSQTVSPTAEVSGAGAAGGEGVEEEDDDDMVVVGPMPAVVMAVGASNGSSPVVTPPLSSPPMPASPVNSASGSPVHPLSAGADANAAAAEPVPKPMIPTMATRSIDGLLFLRELFAMSKFLQVEKRVELFHDLFESLNTPLFLVLNKVLVECRSCPDPAAVPPPLFLASEQAVATQVVGEILTALCIVCSPLLRQVVLRSPTPPVNPVHGPPAAGAAATAAAAATSLTRQSSDGSNEGHKKTYIGRAGVAAANSTSTSAAGTRCAWWEHCTLFLIIDCIVNSPDSFTIQSFGDVLKLVLDLEKTPSSSVKNDNYRFLTSFYDHYLSYMWVPFLDPLNPSRPVPASFYAEFGIPPHQACSGDKCVEGYDASSTANEQPICAVNASRRLIFETLIQCVTAHSYRFKYYAMRNNILSKLLVKAFQCPLPSQGESWMHLLGIKFIKAVLSVKDDFYYKHIEKLDLFKSVMAVFQEIAHKDNMITSCFLEVIEDIRSMNIRNLITYVVQKYAHCFEPVRLQRAVFDKLKIKYDQIMDRSMDVSNRNGGPAGSAAASSSNRFLTGLRGRQQRTFSDFDSEEDYFFGDDDASVGSMNSNNMASSEEVHHRSGGTGEGGDLSQCIKKSRTETGSTATAMSAGVPGSIASIVNAAFVCPEPASSMTRENVRMNSAPLGDAVEGKVLSRSNSVSSAQSTTTGLRGSLIAMLGSYGIEDNDNDGDQDEGNGVSVLSHKNIQSFSSRGAGGISMNIYDEEDGLDRVSELSDSMSTSEEEGDSGRERGGSIDSLPSPRMSLYAGSDFVRATAASSSGSSPPHDGSVGGGDSESGSDSMLPLPPLKSRFEYDDPEDSASFLAAAVARHSHVISATAAAAGDSEHRSSTATANNNSAGGSGKTGISFSLKKKPRL